MRTAGKSAEAGSEAAERPAVSAATVSMQLLASTLSSWLAWPTVAETVVGSILLLRLFSCEKHFGSPKISFFFCCTIALSLVCALGAELAQRNFYGGAAAKGNNGFGWGPSVLCGALLVRHVVEIPVRARFVVLGYAINDKAVEVILALQVVGVCCKRSACLLGLPASSNLLYWPKYKSSASMRECTSLCEHAKKHTCTVS